MRRTIAFLLIVTMNLPATLFGKGMGGAGENDALSPIPQRWRQRLERVKSKKMLIVTLDGGEQVEGRLGEIETETFVLRLERPSQNPGHRGITLARREVRFADVVWVTDDEGRPILPKARPPQGPVGSFAALQESVMPGDPVRIEDLSGRRLEGLVDEIASSHLTVVGMDGKTGQVTFGSGEVARVEVESTRTADRGLRGTLIGAGVGFGWSAAAVARCYDCDEAALAIGMMTGIGAGLGLAFGLLARREIVEPRLVYEDRRSGPEIGFYPILSKDRKGAGVRITF